MNFNIICYSIAVLLCCSRSRSGFFYNSRNWGRGHLLLLLQPCRRILHSRGIGGRLGRVVDIRKLGEKRCIIEWSFRCFVSLIGSFERFKYRKLGVSGDTSCTAHDERREVVKMFLFSTCCVFSPSEVLHFCSRLFTSTCGYILYHMIGMSCSYLIRTEHYT